MSQLQCDGQLWVASVGEVCSFWQQLRDVTILPKGDGNWHIDAGADGLTIPIAVIGGEPCEVRRAHEVVQTEPLGIGRQIGCVNVNCKSGIDLSARSIV